MPKLIERYRNDGIFTPSSLGGTIQYPGVIGGTNWGASHLSRSGVG